MPDAPAFEPFPFSPTDPLAPEHGAVLRWVADATQMPKGKSRWKDVDLKTLKSGRVLLDAQPEPARRIILAALAQVKYWEEGLKRIRDTALSDIERANVPRAPAYVQFAAPRHHALKVVAALIRRAIPFQRDDIAVLLRWCVETGSIKAVPVGFMVKSLDRYAAASPLDDELKSLIRGYADELRKTFEKRKSSVLDQLVSVTPSEDFPLPNDEAFRPTPAASGVGNPLVMHQLKSRLGLAHSKEVLATTRIGLDRFDMPEASPLRAAHERLSAFLAEAAASEKYGRDLREFPAGQAIFSLEPARRTQVLLAAAERHVAALFSPSSDYTDTLHWRSRFANPGVVQALSWSTLHFDRDSLFDFILYLSVRPQRGQISNEFDATLFEAIGQFAKDGAGLTEGERFALHLWRRARITGPPLGAYTPDLAQLTRWIGDGAQFFLVPVECWSDAVNADLAALSTSHRKPWLELLKHALSATVARPSDRWCKKGIELIAQCGEKSFREALKRWLPLVAKGRTVVGTPAFVGDTRGVADSIHDENANALRGFLWLISLLPRKIEFVRWVASVALTAYKKVPGVGPRAVKVGNAAVYCLSQMVSSEAMGQLAMLKVRVRFGTAQKEVEKAFDAAAAELNLPRDQIEEMSVPACGLETVGLREERFGKYRAQLVVTGSDAELRWFDEQSKRLKSVPGTVKSGSAEALNELQTHLRDVQSMLSAQRERSDSLFLDHKTWPVETWRERYVDHPLVGTIARRLIWVVQGTPVSIIDGSATDVNGHATDLPADAHVQLWHPAGRTIEEILAWRRRIESLGVVQPFKQAHREIYLLTDAERRTSRYSNRFAAHILRQHQFNALCAARRWKNKLRLLVDDTYPPASRDLPAWNLRAEFWIEGVGDQHGRDTNESGVFLRLASDQVRFYRMNAASNLAHAGGGGYTTRAAGPGEGNLNEPLTLDQVPELVFSEIMRDVDLFVGVASVGNDPTWQDGGPDGRYIAYWQNYSFGELAATAVSRRETLERLLPRLKIRDQCVLADRFLQVRGSRRTYKIHLGSGNILMEPNDQYLCIVPDARARVSVVPIYLPFEGDATLSIILSKAFLLADDGKIKDEIINRQIDRR